MNFKIKLDHIVNEALGVIAGVAILGAGYIIANSFFGFDSYQGLSSNQIGAVISNLEKNFKIISSVQGTSIWGRPYKRGVLMGPGGSLYYYRFSYENEKPVGIMIFPLYFETWSTTPAIFDTARLF